MVLSSQTPTDAAAHHSALCEMGERPHDHCDCGLPMPLSARRCTLCRLEGLEPKVGRPTPDTTCLRWDQRSYPSRRRRRLAAPDPDGLIALLVAILRPPTESSHG
jgi:hypothetical protein